MCKFKKWYAGAEGYVLQCKDCGHVQLAFGTTMLTLGKDDFFIFTEIVASRVSELTPYREDLKSVVIPTPASYCQIFLTERELLSLHRMLQQADNERAANALLELFQVGDSGEV